MSVMSVKASTRGLNIDDVIQLPNVVLFLSLVVLLVKLIVKFTYHTFCAILQGCHLVP